MKIFSISILIIAFLGLGFGCSKNEEVADLEKEVKEAESIDYLADTIPEQEAAETAAEEYALSPEQAPEEVSPMETMPRHVSSEAFTVQIAAGTNLEFVRLMADRFAARGYDAFVTEVDIDGTAFYRVRIGGFSTVSEAEALGWELKDKYSVDFWVDNNQ